jgi:peptidoglycan/LPS O-acetylase OafA/YrhL
MTTASARPKNREIEALRGIAVLIAILTHLPVLLPFWGVELLRVFNTVFNPGTGVDLFFCISGFVVSRAFLDFFDRHASRGCFLEAFKVFWIRRAFRLLPTSWLWVAVGLLLSIAFNSTGVFSTPWQNLKSAAVVLTVTGNFANQFGMLLHPNDVYWSLALEEQFYFLFPIFLLLVRSTRVRVIVLLALVAGLFFVDRNVHVFATRSALLASGFRFDPIVWGVLIFLFSRTPLYRRVEPVILRNPALSAVALGALVYALVATPARFPAMTQSMGIVAMAAAGIVFLASYERGYVAPVPVLSRLLESVGARSYGIYIIHVAAYRIAFEAWSRHSAARGTALGPEDAPAMIFSAVVLLAVLVESNYRMVEIPLREQGKRIAEDRLQRIEPRPAG